jgi:hypothetical protein
MSNTATEVIDLDGLCLIGELVSVEPVNKRDGTGAVDGFMKCVVKATRAEYRLDLQRVLKETMGDIPLPAFDKLRVGTGRRWRITVGQTRSGDKGQYTNLVALDAVAL